MFETSLTFDELVASAGSEGYDVIDHGGLVVDGAMGQAVEEENLAAAPVRVRFRDTVDDAARAVVADISVSDQTYHLVGDPRRVEALKNRLRSLPPT